MISSAIFMESLVISSSLSRNIPASTLGLPFIVKKMTAIPEATGRFIQTTKNEVILPTQSMHTTREVFRREPLKPVSTTIKRRHHMCADGSSDRFEYTTTSMGKTNTKDTLGKLDTSSMNGAVGGT